MNPFDLTGRHALVTGGSRGIGLGIARALAAAGGAVTLVARGEESLRAARAGLRADLPGATVHTLAADLSDPARAAAVLDAAVAAGGPVDILVNNAGMTRRGPAETLPLADFEEVLRLNVTSLFALAQAFVRHRLAAGGGGRIVNIASLMSEVSRAHTSAYTASKGAVKMLTRNMACEWARHGIHANAIGPGFIRTDLTESLWQNPEFDAWVRQRTPQGRWGKPEDVGRAAVFLASPASDFVNGHVLYVDGGLLASL